MIVGIKYTVNGKRIQKVTNTRTITEAQEILNKVLSTNIDYTIRGNIKLKEFANKWLERRSVTLKPSEADSYRTIINKHIYEKFTFLEKN